MTEQITLNEESLDRERAKLQRIVRNIERLQEKKQETEENIRVFERLLNSEKKGQEASPEPRGALSGMRGKEAYEKVIAEHFADHPFKESRIRLKATELGLLIKGKPVTPDTSRSIVRDLQKEGFLARLEQGVYLYNPEGESRELVSRDESVEPAGEPAGVPGHRSQDPDEVGEQPYRS